MHAWNFENNIWGRWDYWDEKHKSFVSEHSAYQRPPLINFAQISDCSAAAESVLNHQNKLINAFHLYAGLWGLSICTGGKLDV